MNPLLAKLQPYPFEKLRSLIAGNTPPAELPAINLQIGEPKHPTPAVVKDALAAALDGLAAYPLTAGTPELRQAIAAWLSRRYRIPAPDPHAQVLPVNGTREALFAFAQTVLDRRPDARVVCPNPFYQIYEGAALLAGATRLLLLLTRLNRALGLGASAVFLALFVHSLFYSGFFEDPIVWGVMVLAAWAWIALTREPGPPQAPPSPKFTELSKDGGTRRTPSQLQHETPLAD